MVLLFNSEFSSRCYFKLELDENQFWRIDVKSIQSINWPQGPKSINKIIFKSDQDLSKNELQLGANLTIWIHDKSIKSLLNKATFIILKNVKKAKDEENWRKIKKINKSWFEGKLKSNNNSSKLILNKFKLKHEVKDRAKDDEEKKSSKTFERKLFSKHGLIRTLWL